MFTSSWMDFTNRNEKKQLIINICLQNYLNMIFFYMNFFEVKKKFHYKQISYYLQQRFIHCNLIN